MYGYKLVKDMDTKVANRLLPTMPIQFDNDLSIMGEVKIVKLRKYKHESIMNYCGYTCDIEFKGELIYKGNKRYGSKFYNTAWRGNKIRLNKRLKSLTLRGIMNEIKILGLDNIHRLEITKINWV